MSPLFGLTGQTIEAARRALTAQFRSSGLDSPELDGRLLIGAALGLDLTGLIAGAARVIDVKEATRIEHLAARRLSGEPVARILGSREFWGLPFELSPATLVPRPDTETLVEAALEFARETEPTGGGLSVADLGTGSGAILLALLHDWPNAMGLGTDLSEAALRTARENARHLGLQDRAIFVACDYAAALAGPFDLIVSNPPYIGSSEIPLLSREVRDHDPHLALDGGPDGLDAYRVLIPQAARRLRTGGALIVEIGKDQGTDVQHLMSKAGLIVAGLPRRDLSGIGRVILGRKAP